ncbi:hypothetical protein ATEIFO6365_0002011800 [Aspergillus terreus]|uniref:Uncharacterized protein n=1 Tax=Aspergillus terreus TaxID=33178 RepID=A0A5M3YTL1_ASPTE|nr:hypothetical protein ATETN484_0004011800 [Aspergillus terreus]GFF13008.1 hypothetical protein ATEIFO6365_0002011800 [Aspergillus terreus]
MDSLPSAGQLALALAIVKHKPVHLTIKENQPYAKDQYFDSVAFWKRAYEQSEAEQSKLLDRIYDLERRNDSLQSKAQTHVPVREPNEPKRKRAKTQAYPLADRAPLATAPFMRHFYTLQKALQKKSTPSDIARASVQLCKATGDAILKAVIEKGVEIRTPRTKRPLAQPSIVGILHGAETSFRLLLQAAKKLSAPEESVQELGTLTYHMVALYESTLSSLEQYCKSHCNEGAKAKPKSKKSKKTKSNQIDETASRVSRLLDTMASSLDHSCTAHHRILEGFLFLVINRVGKLLSLFTFRDLKQRPDLHSSKLPLPQGVDEPSLAVQVEAKQLIWLLERLLAVLDSFKDRRTSLGHDTEKVWLIEKLPDQLQGTLLQAVFGEDRTWEQVLSRPLRPIDQDMECVDVSDHAVPDWFIREAWRLLGWELLATTFPSGD